MDCSAPGSFVRGILQARILTWAAIPFSRGSSWSRNQTQVSLFAGRFFTVWATHTQMQRTQKTGWHPGNTCDLASSQPPDVYLPQQVRHYLLCCHFNPLLNSIRERRGLTECLAQHRQEEVCVWKSFSRAWLFATPWTAVRQAPLCPWGSPGKNTGVGSLSLLQKLFPTQESNWGLLHCRQILYQLSHQGSPGSRKWWIKPRALATHRLNSNPSFTTK